MLTLPALAGAAGHMLSPVLAPTPKMPLPIVAVPWVAGSFAAVSYPAPKTSTLQLPCASAPPGQVLILTFDTFASDQLCPSSANPVVELEIFHLYTGASGSVTLSE